MHTTADHAGARGALREPTSFERTGSTRGSTGKQPTRRTGQAAALTLAIGVIGILAFLGLGSGAMPYFLVSLPVPLFFLWVSADVTRADER